MGHSAGRNIDEDRAGRRSKRGCAITAVLVILILYAAYRIYDTRFKAARYPSSIGLEETIFEHEEGCCGGPGSNETGLVVHRMRKDDALRLIRLAPALTTDDAIRLAMGGTENHYGVWRRTPITMTQEDGWRSSYRWTSATRPGIATYLGRYGFGIRIDPRLEEQVNRIISQPGSYYAYGGGGSVLVVSPPARRVVFAFAG